MINAIILGATGNIGNMCAEVIALSNSYKIVAITGYNNTSKLEELQNKYSVPYAVSLKNYDVSDFINKLASIFPYENTVVINAIDGFSGLKASVSAIHQGYTLILANKETIVCGGTFFLNDAKKRNIKIKSIDSEMYAIESLILAFGKQNINEYIITASGGPFYNYNRHDLHDITPSKAYNHPIWKMGKNISLNSSTLLNKALEIIEAKNLFALEPKKIKVLINKESYIHSIVQLKNGVLYPQMYAPTQKIAIRNVLGIDNIDVENPLPSKLSLSLEHVSEERFPFIKMAFECSNDDSKAIVLNSAGEKANELFKNGKIAFDEIESYVEEKLKFTSLFPINSYEDIYKLDKLARS